MHCLCSCLTWGQLLSSPDLGLKSAHHYVWAQHRPSCKIGNSAQGRRVWGLMCWDAAHVLHQEVGPALGPHQCPAGPREAWARGECLLAASKMTHLKHSWVAKITRLVGVFFSPQQNQPWSFLNLASFVQSLEFTVPPVCRVVPHSSDTKQFKSNSPSRHLYNWRGQWMWDGDVQGIPWIQQPGAWRKMPRDKMPRVGCN